MLVSGYAFSQPPPPRFFSFTRKVVYRHTENPFIRSTGVCIQTNITSDSTVSLFVDTKPLFTPALRWKSPQYWRKHSPIRKLRVCVCVCIPPSSHISYLCCSVVLWPAFTHWFTPKQRKISHKQMRWEKKRKKSIFKMVQPNTSQNLIGFGFYHARCV